MNKKIMIRKLVFWVVIPLVWGTSACTTDISTNPQAWIDSPREGASISLNTPVSVVSHVFAQGGVAEVVLSVNGEPYRRDVPGEGSSDFVSVQQEWTAKEAGTYTLQVQGYDRQGQPGNPDSVSIVVREAAVLVKPQQVISVTPVITDTPVPVISVTPVISITPNLPQASTISFFADPATIRAGTCSNLYWNVANAQRVIFGGVDQPFSGSFQACLCESARYPLRVINLDGTETQQAVDVNVTGTCVTETPEPPVEEPEPPAADTNPPSVPNPAVPANGLELSCRSSQNLVWQPSTDDASGISGYYVKLEMQIKAGQWQSAGGYGPVSDKQVTVNVDCGGIYRWMVRAEDGVGNVSGWSSPSNFSVVLK